MDQGNRIDVVRRLVVDTLAEFGLAGDTASVCETPLLRDAARSGRRFQCQGVRAVWFADDGGISFFAEDGRFLKTVAVGASASTAKAA